MLLFSLYQFMFSSFSSKFPQNFLSGVDDKLKHGAPQGEKIGNFHIRIKIHKHLSTQSRGCALNPNKNEAAMQESRITTKYLSSVTNETQMEIIAEKLFVLYCK